MSSILESWFNLIEYKKKIKSMLRNKLLKMRANYNVKIFKQIINMVIIKSIRL